MGAVFVVTTLVYFHQQSRTTSKDAESLIVILKRFLYAQFITETAAMVSHYTQAEPNGKKDTVLNTNY